MPLTRLTVEEQIDHYKADSYFTMDPAYLTVQEADGTQAALLANYDSSDALRGERLQCQQRRDHSHSFGAGNSGRICP